MTHVNLCLRRFFFSFNVFVLVIGGLIIVTALALDSLHDFKYYQDSFGVWTTSLYSFGSVTMVISILGAHGAHTKNRVSLTVFLVCMVTGSLLMLRAGVIAAAARPNLESVMEERWHSLLPLDQASDDIKHHVETLQKSLHCCGLFGYRDWEDSIPDSCLCKQEVQEECQTISYRNFLLNLFWQKKSVFTQPCLPLIMNWVATNGNIALGVTFGLFVLALLGVVLSSWLIYSMYDTASRLNRLTMPNMFTDQPPAYQQLYELPE